MHSWDLAWRFRRALRDISAGIKAISSRILVFDWRSVVGRALYALFLRWAHIETNHTPTMRVTSAVPTDVAEPWDDVIAKELSNGRHWWCASMCCGSILLRPRSVEIRKVFKLKKHDRDVPSCDDVEIPCERQSYYRHFCNTPPRQMRVVNRRPTEQQPDPAKSDTASVPRTL